jgi:hypothetical protein
MILVFSFGLSFSVAASGCQSGHTSNTDDEELSRSQELEIHQESITPLMQDEILRGACKDSCDFRGVVLRELVLL